MGEVLFWVLKRVVGDSVYNSRIHMAWVKVYSRMLTTMVPIAVSLELRIGSHNQNKRLTDSSMFSDSKSSMSSNSDSSVSAHDDQLESEKVRKPEPTR